VINFGMEETE